MPSRHRDIGLREIIALEDKRHAVVPCAGIGEAIAEIERGGMPALAEAALGIERKGGHVGGDGDDVDAEFREISLDIPWTEESSRPSPLDTLTAVSQIAIGDVSLVRAAVSLAEKRAASCSLKSIAQKADASKNMRVSLRRGCR